MTKRLTYKFVYDQFFKKGHTLLSKKYINNSTKMLVMCPNGHTYKITYADFYSGYGCSKCSGNKKLTYEFVKKQTPILAPGYELLSTKYINAGTNLKFKCDKGHIFEINWNKFYNRNQRCKICFSNKKPTIKAIKKYIENYNYKLVSTKYKGSQEFLEIMCSNNHKYKVKWANFQQGKRCPICQKENNKGNKHYKWKNYTEEDLEDIDNYKNRVVYLSNQNFIKYYYQINPNKLKRGAKYYQLDHIYSIIDGFNNSIPPEVISNPNNLQMLWYHDNLSKLSRSDQTKQELYLGYYKHELEK